MAKTVETPSQSIVRAAAQPKVITDSEGRKLTMKRLNALDRMQCFAAVGPELVRNQAYLGYAMLVFMVSDIDGVPVPRPSNRDQVEALVNRLDDHGIDALANSAE